MSLINPIEIINEYVNPEVDEWRRKENANSLGVTLSGMDKYIAEKTTAEYWLTKVYTERQAQMHRDATISVNDLGSLSSYCAGWNLQEFLQEGLGGVPTRITSNPPKHLQSAIDQLSNFLGLVSVEHAGAQAVNSFDTFMAPFIHKDSTTNAEIKQCLQSLIYNCNLCSRSGGQSPFINISFDVRVPDDLKDQNPIIADEVMDFTYGDLQPEVDRINIIFNKIMIEGDKDGRPFTFPIPTYSIVDDFEWDSEVADLIFTSAAKYGYPYFQNFLNSDMKPSDVRSMCCRLRLDLNEVRKHTNTSLFGAADSTGSIGVVTINMARLGYKHQGDMQGLINELDEILNESADMLDRKRKVIVKLFDQGFYPYTKHYLKSFDTFFSTIGVNGMNEMVANYSNGEYNITDPRGHDEVNYVLDHILSRMPELQNRYGNLMNLEAVPAESKCYIFAKEDKKRYPDIITAGSGENIYYTNSSHIPVGYTKDIFETLDLSDESQCKYTGGTVIHAYTNDSITDKEQAKNLVKTICENYKLPFISITPTYIICENCGYIDGDHNECPKCGNTDIECFTRVMGYLRSTSSFNKGKVGEYKDRQYYDLSA